VNHSLRNSTFLFLLNACHNQATAAPINAPAVSGIKSRNRQCPLPLIPSAASTNAPITIVAKAAQPKARRSKVVTSAAPLRPRHQKEKCQQHNVRIVAQRMNRQRQTKRQLARMRIQSKAHTERKVEQAQHHIRNVSPAHSSESENGQPDEYHENDDLHGQEPYRLTDSIEPWLATVADHFSCNCFSFTFV